MAQVEQKRIGAIDRIEDEQLSKIIKQRSEAKKWALAMDYVEPDIENPEPGQDQERDRGTKHVLADRVGFLTANRLVPQGMLPSFIAQDAIKDGQMSKIGGETGVWIFTEISTGNKYVCPKPTQETGGSLPSIDTIYRDALTVDGRTIYTQYRYVPDANSGGSSDETGRFVPIPNDLIAVDGEGTRVTDINNNYTRQIDLAIGSPSTPSDTDDVRKVLFINANHELTHALSGVTAGVYPATPNAEHPDFGNNIYIPNVTVNETGHVTSAGTYTVVIPNTRALSGTPGLVKIGTNIQSIGQANSAGTVAPTGGEYVAVAAADHVHSASKLTLTNTNDGIKEYRGSDDVSYDFRKFLKANLPASNPSSANQVLVTKSSSTGGYRDTEWKTVDDAITPKYAFVTMVDNNVGTTAAKINFGNSPSAAATIAYADATGGAQPNALKNLTSGKLYVVSYTLKLTRTVGYNIDKITFAVVNSSNTIKASCDSILDETILPGLPNYVNGTVMFVADSTTCSFTVKCDDAEAKWKIVGADSTIQIAEVK